MRNMEAESCRRVNRHASVHSRFVDSLTTEESARVIAARPDLYSTSALRDAAIILSDGGEPDQCRALRIATELEARARACAVDPAPSGNGRIRRALVIGAFAALAFFVVTLAAQAGAKASADVARYHEMEALK